MKHVGGFSVQCEEVDTNDFLKFRLFMNSFTGSAFLWYVNLFPNFIFTWQEMESQFHTQFYRTELEISIVDLTRLIQQFDGSVERYMSQFKKA